MYKFKRPEHLAFPHVYYTFTAKDKSNERDVEYRVQDILVEDYDAAVAFMVKYFIPDETFCASRDVKNLPITVKVHEDFWKSALEEKLSIGCFRDDELVGMNVLIVKSKDDLDDNLEVNFDKFVLKSFNRKIFRFQTRRWATFSAPSASRLISLMSSKPFKLINT